jgi:hypothetical protein
MFSLKLPIFTKPKISCNDCRYNENGTCKLFKYRFATDERKLDYYVNVEQCRADVKLCGPYGVYFNKK